VEGHPIDSFHSNDDGHLSFTATTTATYRRGPQVGAPVTHRKAHCDQGGGGEESRHLAPRRPRGLREWCVARRPAVTVTVTCAPSRARSSCAPSLDLRRGHLRRCSSPGDTGRDDTGASSHLAGAKHTAAHNSLRDDNSGCTKDGPAEGHRGSSTQTCTKPHTHTPAGLRQISGARRVAAPR
jgi:hypothetical protein